MSKVKLAVYWGAACGGCDVAILDIHERILAVKEACEFYLWPIVMDFKYADVEALPDKHIDVTLYSGAVRNSENRHLAQLLRQKSAVLVAFGSCAHTGGIPALANFTTREGVFERAYLTSESTANPDGVVPKPVTAVAEGDLELPVMFDRVHALDQVVEVDYYVPGCPPSPDRIWEVLSAIVSGATLPPAGSVIGASDRALCDSCERKRLSEKKIGEFKRIALTAPDPETCFLDQGLLCLGPVTRDGCGLQCVKHSAMPCRGCYGLPPDVQDQGAKMIAALASVIDATEPPDIERVVSTLPDPVGYFYRFSASHSLLGRSKR
jgi:F420-non-reducing hydrogenase small subunit